MKKVIVTGASGFIGRHTLDLLLKIGYEVHGIYNSTLPNNFNKDVFLHQVNLLDPNEIELLFSKVQPTHLLHLAWDVTPGFRDSVSNFDWVLASLQILKSFKKNGGKRTVYAGTCFQYEFVEGIYNEITTPKKPVYLYGFAKQKLQEMFEKYAEETCLSTAWGYIFYPYGEGDSPNKLIPKSIQAFKDNQIFESSSGEQIRDYIYASDVANAFVTILDTNIQGAFNIGAGQGVAVKEILLNIATLLNKEQLLHIGAIESYSKEPNVMIADISLIQKTFNWKPQYDICSGLKKILIP